MTKSWPPFISSGTQELESVQLTGADIERVFLKRPDLVEYIKLEIRKLSDHN